MKNTKSIIFFLLISLCLLFNPSIICAADSINNIKFMTENYPPYNYCENGRLKGIYVDVLMEISKRTDSTLKRDDIDLMPWARGYRSILKNKKKCLFGMARNKDRENLFKWAGPVSHGRTVLIAKAGFKLKINCLDDIHNLKIGVVKDDVNEKFLLNAGIKKANLVYSYGNKAVKEILIELDRGIIDLWAYGETTARWLIKKFSFNPKNYKSVYLLNNNKGYFAFSKDVSDSFINRFQNELDKIMADGTYRKIASIYLSEELGLR
ncbi:MAG: ABC transporter substrate-binding protein [Desulfobacula sp.]|nr:ABC transporter substrate-binding protein [Desulfobacula sp.]